MVEIFKIKWNKNIKEILYVFNKNSVEWKKKPNLKWNTHKWLNLIKK